MKSVVTIGGGTGQFALLSGLKKYELDLAAIVTMADDGGSTGVLRDELGVLPPGDIRQCLVALADADSIMRDLFTYRYDRGGLKGHSFGNIFLSTLEKITGSMEEAVRVAGMVLATRGRVIPVTTQDVTLLCGTQTIWSGQHVIMNAAITEKETLRLSPAADANPKAVAAIEKADCIVIGPGNLYCSIIPNLLVRGVPDAISRSHAAVVFNCNLMTTPGHTDGFGIGDFVAEIERYIGAGRVTHVTCNDTLPDPELVERYASSGEHLVVPPSADAASTFRLLPAPLVSRAAYAQVAGDPIRRTLVRHDPDVLAGLIVRNCLGGMQEKLPAGRYQPTAVSRKLL